MKNLMERGIDLANILGLVCGAIAIYYLGYNIGNQKIILFGTATLVIFIVIFLFNIVLLIRDFIRYGIRIIPRQF